MSYFQKQSIRQTEWVNMVFRTRQTLRLPVIMHISLYMDVYPQQLEVPEITDGEKTLRSHSINLTHFGLIIGVDSHFGR